MSSTTAFERLNKEIKRRLKVIGRHPDELGNLSLIYAVSQKYAEQQNLFTIADLQRKLWSRLRESKIEMIEQVTPDVWAA